MTNKQMAQLLKDGEAFLKQTTVGYRKVATYPPEKYALTNWAKGLAKIDSVIKTLIAQSGSYGDSLYGAPNETYAGEEVAPKSKKAKKAKK